MEPDLPHHIVEERHDGDPAQPVTLLQLGKQGGGEVAATLLTKNNTIFIFTQI